jgi:hypothetical protein
MKILVDQEGRNVIQQLCDLALKQGGVKNLNQVNRILKSVKLLPTPEEKELDRPKSLEKDNIKVIEKADEEPKEKSEKKKEPEKEEVVEETTTIDGAGIDEVKEVKEDKVVGEE